MMRNGRNELRNTGRGRVSGLARMLVMFAVLVVVAAIAVFAHSGYDAVEDRLGGYIGQPSYICQLDEGYIGYAPNGYEYEDYCNYMMPPPRQIVALTNIVTSLGI
ncbi:MAG: hypothetical protein FWC73_13560 [Defluviitaleaceae bacterium]|nr:hypothetical protein [Defluviitaleaceae bacterium]